MELKKKTILKIQCIKLNIKITKAQVAHLGPKFGEKKNCDLKHFCFKCMRFQIFDNGSMYHPISKSIILFAVIDIFSKFLLRI